MFESLGDLVQRAEQEGISLGELGLRLEAEAGLRTRVCGEMVSRSRKTIFMASLVVTRPAGGALCRPRPRA